MLSLDNMTSTVIWRNLPEKSKALYLWIERNLDTNELVKNQDFYDALSWTEWILRYRMRPLTRAGAVMLDLHGSRGYYINLLLDPNLTRRMPLDLELLKPAPHPKRTNPKSDTEHST